MYSVEGNIQKETYIDGNRTPSEEVAKDYGVRTCCAYCVQSGSNGSVTVYFRFFVRTYGTIYSTLQSALCSGTWGTTMAGTYLQGATGATWYYGTNATSNQYDYKVTLSRDGSNLSRTEKVGWYGSSGATYQSSVTLYYGAPHSVTYVACDASDGTKDLPSTQTKYYNTTLKLSDQIPTRAGYTFKGWSTSKNATKADYASGVEYTGNAKLVLYPVWQENYLTVNYYSNHATGAFSGALNTVSSTNSVKVLSQNFYYSENYPYGLANYSTSSGACYLTRTGYSATGYWGTTNSGGTLVDENKSFDTGQALAKALNKDLSSGNQTIGVAAQWKINTYTITYNANGGSGAPSAQTKTYGVALTLSSTKPTRTGYTFLGWSTSSTATSATYSAGGSYTANSAATLYAVWSINSYKLDVNGRNGTATAGNTNELGTFDVYINGVAKATNVTDFYQSVNYGASYEIKNIKPLTGHTYDAGTTEGALKGTVGTSTVSVRLSFKTNTITLNYRSNYATEAFNGALNKVSADSDVLVCSETYPAVYHSWETEGGIVLNDVAGYSSTASRCYLARNGYNPTGSWGTSQSGGSLVKELEGFVDGRKLASLLGVSCDTSSVSVNLYPQWQQKNSWVVFLNTNGGEGTIPCPSAYVGESITLPSETPTRTNYRFLGWSASSTSTTAEYSPGDTIPSSSAGDSIVLYAVWQLLSVSVYLSETWKHASAVWVYGSDGTPKKALSVTVYDSGGLPHTSAL